MQKLQRIWTLPFIILSVLGVIFFILYRQSSTLDKDDNLIREVTPPEMETMRSEPSLSTGADQPARANQKSGVSVHGTTEASLDASPPTDDSAIDPMLEIIAPIVEGVDSFTAAKRLKRNGFPDYARQYARKAVAENPGAFEELLFLAQLLPLDEENGREALFRRLVRMDSTSVDALYGLGTTINTDQPAESIPYLKAAIAADPSHGSAYRALGGSYERLGMYDEALAAYKKGSKLPPPGVDIRRWHPVVSLMHIQAIEAGNPIFKRIQGESQRQLPEKSAPEDTFPESPFQEAEPPPAPPEGTGRGTGLNDEPGDSTPSSESREASAADQRSIEELIQIIEEYEASLSSPSDPSAAVEGRLADLERSIESRPNRAESYLKLARAYQEAGEDEKAAAVYRQARERFPDDKAVQRESEAYRERYSSQRPDEDASEEDEER